MATSVHAATVLGLPSGTSAPRAAAVSAIRLASFEPENQSAKAPGGATAVCWCTSTMASTMLWAAATSARAPVTVPGSVA